MSDEGENPPQGDEAGDIQFDEVQFFAKLTQPLLLALPNGTGKMLLSLFRMNYQWIYEFR